MNWRDRLGSKLVSLEEAVGKIESGQTVAASPFTCSPLTLGHGLIERGRKGGLENVQVHHLASAIGWTEPELQGVFRLRDSYATTLNRAACHAGGGVHVPHVRLQRADRAEALLLRPCPECLRQGIHLDGNCTVPRPMSWWVIRPSV